MANTMLNYQSTGLSLMDIDSDCFFEISDFLRLKDQIALSQVTGKFEYWMCYYWSLKLRTLKLSFCTPEICTADFDYLMRLHCNALEVLILKFMDAQHLAVLKKYKFPKVHDFRFSQAVPFFMNNYDLKALNHIFANLQTFSPQGRFNGSYLINWPNLRHLCVSHCRDFNMNSLIAVLKNLRLETLKMDVLHQFEMLPFDEQMINCFETLRICVFNASELLYQIADNLQYFRNLREMTITQHPSAADLSLIYELFERHKRYDIIELEYANTYANPLAGILSNYQFLRNLRKISFLNATHAFRMAYNVDILPMLRIINFYYCEEYTQSHVLNLLEMANDLDEISIEHCTFSFPKLIVDAPQILSERKKLLNLNFHCNYHNLWGSMRCVELEVNGITGRNMLNIRSVDTPNINYEPMHIIFKTDELP